MVASRVVRAGELRSSKRRDIRELDRLKPMREPRRVEPRRGRNIFSGRTVQVATRPPSQRIRPRPVEQARVQLTKTPMEGGGCVLPRSRPRPALSVRDRLSKPSTEGGIGTFGERSPIFERSTVPELARFCRDRAEIRKTAEASKRSRVEEPVLEVTVSSPSEELQVTVPGANMTSRSSRKKSRWDTPLPVVEKPPERVVTVGEKANVEIVNLEQAQDVAEGGSFNLDDGQESGLVAPLVLPLRVDDPRVRLGLARPKEPEVASLSVSSMGLPIANSTAYWNRPGVLPQSGIGTVKVKVMADVGGGMKCVQEGYLLPEDFPEPAATPMAVSTNVLPSQSVVNAPSSSSGNVNVTPPVGMLSRSQRRSRIARERRDKVNELQAENAALRSNQQRDRSLVDVLRDKSARSGLIPSPEFMEFARQVDRLIPPD